MGYATSLLGKGLIAWAFGALVPLAEGVAATSEHAAPAARPRLALVSLVAPELLNKAFVQDISARDPVLSRGDTDFAEYVEWHRWAAGSPAGPPGADGDSTSPRQN